MKSTSFTLRMLVLVIALLGSAAASLADVVIVRASDAEPYMQAEAALRDQLAPSHANVKSLLMKSVAQQGVAASIGKLDVVVAIGTSAAHWLHDQLPAGSKLVYCMVTNADEAGLLQGQLACGVTTDVALAEQFKLIAEALPQARVLGTLYRSDTTDGRNTLKLLNAALPAGWRIEAVAVDESPSIADAIELLTKKHADVIWTTADQKLYSTATVRELLLGALREKTPVWGFSPAFVRAGGLIGVGVEPRAQGKRAAEMVQAELSGGNKTGPIAEPPPEYQIALNLVVAEQLGIEIPDALLRRATYVYRPEK